MDAGRVDEAALLISQVPMLTKTDPGYRAWKRQLLRDAEDASRRIAAAKKAAAAQQKAADELPVLS